ncbi:ATP phosphoribosyltransferase [Arenimonas composti]|uniref:ATP phosphoribosyltransferase n=1 Tax=Arenimonas composti TR7-09 = DSM 18010 TaxID=1121013 RepID=A0A091BX81_9GAMM|nr:ATP phosphoribosyltransferase [Arenimonas composti]KFN48925.1 hypothetical protein P873_01095 [Arenimonas composti TR7-09 = DSM 18010]
MSAPEGDRLRIAVQKSGRLSAPSLELLTAVGLGFAPAGDRLFCAGENAPVDLLRVRDDDIPGLVADGGCDLGIVGADVLGEFAAGAGVRPPSLLRELGFGRCRLAIALPQGLNWSGPASLAGLRIATSHPRHLAAWLRANAVAAEIVTLSGAVEIAPRLGRADAVCDLVSSGATLAANALREVATVATSQAVLVGRAGGLDAARAAIAGPLLQRLDAVLGVRGSRLVLCQAAREALPALLPLLPEVSTHTVTAIEGDPERISLQALCRRAPDWPALEALRGAGARDLLVLPVERMLA